MCAAVCPHWDKAAKTCSLAPDRRTLSVCILHRAGPDAEGSGMPPDWMVRDEDPSPIPDARPCPFCGSRRVTLQVYDDEWCWIPDDAVRDLLGIYDDRPVTPTERRIAYDGYEGLGYIWCAECQGCGAQVHADSWRGALDAWERRA